MKELEGAFFEEVRRRGRVTFAEYMSWALYHPAGGYYMKGGPKTGREGDFITSVQTGPLFARLLAESFREMWATLGGEHFTLVELGGADGTLAERVLRTFEEQGRGDGISYYLVERGAKAREAARRKLSRFRRVKILDDLASLEHVSGVEGCIFSNEFFDALPVHRVVGTAGGLKELFVAAEGEKLVEVPGEPSTPKLAAYLREQDVALADGQKAEICLAMEDAVAEIERTLGRGFVLTIDYGEPSPDLYREARTDGSLRGFRKHQLAAPLEAPGETDLTAHVDFGRLAELGRRLELAPLIFASQGTYLLNSAEKLLRETVEAAGKNADRSVLGQVQQLLHPESFGGKFHVLVQGKNVGRPELSGGKVNRVGRLAPAKQEI